MASDGPKGVADPGDDLLGVTTKQHPISTARKRTVSASFLACRDWSGLDRDEFMLPCAEGLRLRTIVLARKGVWDARNDGCKYDKDHDVDSFKSHKKRQCCLVTLLKYYGT